MWNVESDNMKPNEPSQAPQLRDHHMVTPQSCSCQNHCHPLVSVPTTHQCYEIHHCISIQILLPRILQHSVSAHGVDSHCKATKPSHDVPCTDSSTQPTVGLDLDLSQENPKNSKKSPKIPNEILEIPSPLPMVRSWTLPCMLFLWPSPSVLLEMRHSWRQFTWRTGMISPWMDFSLLRDWPITSYSRS